ncbi:HAMP domain-containing sensor histidine kinase [Amycolatopsis cynarae]|uniref:Signal transduction histidine-protein kinase/phosphatase MprB n=1 Tax=Amycolatopsis cynarae TaxID=2995223 RepID=A0ABY7B432_9PSEU|nr:HAMP domain-containing sensor histidine kinase [Amycolatopsis sp. HUAS 11-8]WAL66687.1 HAMP domain-containing sensor histidine kinase [Amycolatopsis sp. HUAS 11-8]
MRPYFGLRARIAAAVVFVTVVATTAMAFASYQVQASDTTDRFLAAARAGYSSDLVQARFVAQYLTGGGPADMVAGYMYRERGVRWTLLDFSPGAPRPAIADGHYPFDPNRMRGQVPPVELPVWLVDGALARYTGSWTMESLDDPAYCVLAGQVLPDLVLVEFYNMGALQDELAKLRRNLTMIAVLVAALGVAAALVAAKRIQRPVQAVASAARELGLGDLNVRVPVRGRDELAELAASFNAMARQIGDSIKELRAKDQQQRRFVADVAHDLRTPLAAMVAAVDGLDHPEVSARSAHLLGVQTRRLATLVEDLMEISRFDAGGADFQAEPVELTDLWADAVELSGITAEPRALGDDVVVGDPRRLHTIARNLLTNAVHHGAPPFSVLIDGTDADRVTVRVADSGPGVPEDLLDLVFDRFVRGDRARTATEGSGLGLAIARENARVHGGDITVANDGGAVFTLTLPRTAAPASAKPGP